MSKAMHELSATKRMAKLRDTVEEVKKLNE